MKKTSAKPITLLLKCYKTKIWIHAENFVSDPGGVTKYNSRGCKPPEKKLFLFLGPEGRKNLKQGFKTMTKNVRNGLILAVLFAGIVAAIALREQQEQVIASFSPASVVGQGKPVLLELGSDRCMPCKMMTPVLKELSEQCPGQFTVAFHDVWKDASVGEKYGVSVIPTQIFFDKDGVELFRHEGFFAKDQILAKWKELGIAAVQ
jgi:thioredoxin 1